MAGRTGRAAASASGRAGAGRLAVLAPGGPGAQRVAVLACRGAEAGATVGALAGGWWAVTSAGAVWDDPEIPDFAEQVLDVVDTIPPGRVMSYGDVAECLGRGGPRQVGRVMSLWGGGVAWWRVIRADGALLAGHEREALARYREEGTPLRAAGAGGGLRVDMSLARWLDGGHPDAND